jgi:dipeptidase D
MNPNSKLLVVAVEQYKNLYGKEPFVGGIHAGLECGLFSEKFPGMDMVSLGPTMRGVHSPDERMHIPSVQLVWDHLLALLANI